jgi:peptide/nickel transport system permease protein
MFTLPLMGIFWLILQNHPQQRRRSILGIVALHFLLFFYLAYRTPQDPAANVAFNQIKQEAVQQALKDKQNNPLFASPFLPDWERDLAYMTPYEKLNLILRDQQRKSQHEKLSAYADPYAQIAKQRGKSDLIIPTLWHLDELNEQREVARQKTIESQLEPRYLPAKRMLHLLQHRCHSIDPFINKFTPWTTCQYLLHLKDHNPDALIRAKQIVDAYELAQAQLKYIGDRKKWMKEQSANIQLLIMPLLRPFHWEDDAGGDQALNQVISWWDLTRINRKDMVAGLIFGIRISLSVGLLAVALALAIGIPIGALAGFYGGILDIFIYRLIEIWEAMPTFFMLLMVVAFLQSKSIFIVIAVIGLFGWTSFSRYVRGEFFKQKQLPYVEACRAAGFNDRYIIFVHLLPNAIPPILTLVPFAVMGAITSEAGLSFLGLGEEGSTSWGILMDEGRTAFPAESYLLWPPAALLTILLVAIALVGDALRDALDPKLHRG